VERPPEPRPGRTLTGHACLKPSAPPEKPTHQPAPHAIRRDTLPAPQRPNKVWVADISDIPTEHDHWLYLATVMDLGSRRVVGWAMSASIDTQLVLDALAMARHQSRPPTGLLFHSDRGVQDASGDFRAALQAASLVPFMSRKAHGYDNAAMESFWATLKRELVYQTRFLTHADAHQQIFDSIARFNDAQRLHSALGYLSPAQFEHQSSPTQHPFLPSSFSRQAHGSPDPAHRARGIATAA
jgi:putative transposase